MTISEGVSDSSSNPKQSSISSSSNGMISGMSDRYITPEYLAPLPSSEKSGKSPLQLLAQTCSQIGADPVNNSKLLLNEKNNNHHLHHHQGFHHPSSGGGVLHQSPYDSLTDLKKSQGSSNNRSPILVVTDPKPVSFKPYETSSKGPSSPKVISLSPETRSPSSSKGKSSRSSPASNHSSSSKATSPSSSALPVIRSGMEILSGAKEAYGNPAFRPSFGSGVCRDPYCRDPTCPTAVYNAQLASALAGLPLGYAELLQAQHKFSMMNGYSSATQSTTASSSSATTTTTASSSGTQAGPYICNWMNGREGYCGKRHSSAEELLQHLRTHTSLSADALSLGGSSLYPSLLTGGGPIPGRYNGSSNSSSSSSSSRYQPYTKPATPAPPPPPPGLPPLFGGIPPGLGAGFPPSLLSGAYSPSSLYALYGSRLAGSLP